MNLLLLINILRFRKNVNKCYLKIFYLLGARMDRPIDENSPPTLGTITSIINKFVDGWAEISLFDVHSRASEVMLQAKNSLPIDAIE